MSEGIGDNSIMDIINRPEIQIFASAAIVRQSARLELPDVLVQYHTGILEELGVNVDKLKYMKSEDLTPILPDVLQIRR